MGISGPEDLMADPTPVPRALPNRGLRFGRYTLHYHLATGGMAKLYVGTYAELDGSLKTVAIKILHPHLSEDPEFVKMFIDEARLIARISHGNVVNILELGRVGTDLFIVMEYVEGESILALLKRTKPTLAQSARMVANAAAGIHAAHDLRDSEGTSLDVIHRDVTPDNILIGYDGQVKVVDFGVARARDNMHKTVAGSIKGKFSYMAPEQASSGKMDRRLDVFALGIVLFEMTTYRRLFKRKTDADTIGAVLSCRVTPPSRLVENYPRQLERVVLTALQKDPAKRFQTAREMQQALEHYLISEGDPVLPFSIREMMADIFPERIQLKRHLASRFHQEPTGRVTISELISEMEPTTRVSMKHSQSGRFFGRGWQPWLLAATTLATVVSLVSLIYVLAVGDRTATSVSLRGSEKKALVWPKDGKLAIMGMPQSELPWSKSTVDDSDQKVVKFPTCGSHSVSKQAKPQH
jgi:serine/threonine-protein kinase